MPAMETTAVVFAAPRQLGLAELPLVMPDGPFALIDVIHSGISTGTERLLWSGDMPPFPGMGYPLVPGYETVGRIARTPSGSNLSEGDLVYVPGANCYGPVRGLFGGAASRIAVTPERLTRLDDKLADTGVLLALAATAHHASVLSRLPELIIGHGVLGRLLARIVIALGGSPTVWETNATRREGASGYEVIAPETDERKDYDCIADVSGDVSVIDNCVSRLAKRGEIILAGFYSAPLQFVFPPAFMREAAIRIAAQWEPKDMETVTDLIASGRLSLDGLITHRRPASEAASAYETAFNDPECLKMILDWRTAS
jgi:3-hydroxyethyl bacteriochlorophyllide a dehydrogenase